MSTLSILYEDEYVVVFDKPAGLMTHGDGRSEEPTLADIAGKLRPETLAVGEPMRLRGAGGEETLLPRPGIVHRLDKDTSGALIVAKTPEAFEFLKKEFQGRTVEKKYRALVHGFVTEDSGVIDQPLGRSPKDFRVYSAHATARGERRDAATEYRVLARFEEGDKKYTALELFPKTGRTHQIRAHLKFIHHPVVCDALYAGKLGCGLGLSRLALHAASISFNLPSGTRVAVSAPLPPDMAAVWKRHSLA